MKKKALIIFLTIICLMFAIIAFYGTARPGYGDNHSDCHSSAGYTIGTNVIGDIQATNSSNVVFNITATGTNLFVQAMQGFPNIEDNNLFVILPTTNRINESSIYDLDPTANSIIVEFNITTPAADGYYTIFIIAGNDATGSAINFVIQRININVGDVEVPVEDPLVKIFEAIFDHLGFYLGLSALILLSLGTVLVLVNESKFVKLHGILAGGSWILTVVNVVAGIATIPVNQWFDVYPPIYHYPHIFLGTVGLITGFLSMLFGIAAERKPARLTGYITLISWWAAYILGYLSIIFI